MTLMPEDPWRSVRRAMPWAAGISVAVSGLCAAFGGIAWPMVFAAPLVTVAVAGAGRPPRRLVFDREPDITCDADGVRKKGQLLVGREDIVQAVVVPVDEESRQCVVEITRRGFKPRLRLLAPSVPHAREALHALELDAGRSVAELWCTSRWLAVPLPVRLFAEVAALVALVWIAAATSQPMLVLAAVALRVVGYAVPTRIRVGADGIWQSWLGIRRFYAFSRVADVRWYEEECMGTRTSGVELELTDGKRVCLPAARAAWNKSEAPKLLERVEEAFEAYRAARKSGELSCLLRDKRTFVEWVHALRAVGSGANVDLRTPPVPADRLLDVVEDSGATPLARASAAVAISSAVSPSERARIRVAAKAAAAPGLRRALERAAAPEAHDEELAEHLAVMEAMHAR